jgi:competence protein ComFA
MEIVIYCRSGDLTPRLSLAFEVDQYLWQQKGHSVRVLLRTRSIGKAFHSIKKVQPYLYDQLSHSKPLWTRIESIRLAEKIYAVCEGRSLLLEEMTECLQQNDIFIGDTQLYQMIQILFLQGRVLIQPAVGISVAVMDWRCNRCQASVSHLVESFCAHCGERCVMCQHCYLLGKARSCVPLLRFKRRIGGEKKQVPLASIFYTPWQQRAVAQIEDFYQTMEQRLLFWAVTGAGKTEVMMPLIQKVLEEGRKVLWVTPRKDVVLELLPRFRQVFQQETVIGLYGGSPDLWKESSFVVATSHQALRFHQYFDLGIVDEVDAFPLYRNRMLEAGIRGALTQRAKEIYLTATPPAKWQSLVKYNFFRTILLPKRYHGKPIPIPKIVYEWSLWNKIFQGQCVPAVKSFLDRMRRHRGQGILFVPRIRDVKPVCAWLKKQFSLSDQQLAGVHSQSPKREQIIQAFRDGKIDLLVSTTVLERGVTIPKAHVLVLSADHPVFDRSTLVQITGRVGRSAYYQLGEVWFLTSQKTQAQVQAIQECRQLNRWAQKEDFQEKVAHIQ